VLLTALVLLAVGIVTLMAVLEVRDVSGGSWAIAAAFAVIGLILLAIAFRFSRTLDGRAGLGDMLRSSSIDLDRASRPSGPANDGAFDEAGPNRPRELARVSRRWAAVTERLVPVRELETRLAYPPAPGSFSDAEIEGLPDPVRRYLGAAIESGTPLASSARFRMHGSIKLGKRWVRFRAREIEAPHYGFVWAARAAGVIVGSDRYMQGHGAMRWKLLGLIPVVHAEGSDVSRSAAGRAAAEAVWVPTALLPRSGVTWTATDPHHITAKYRLDDADIELRYTLGDDARVRSVVFDRWGDPDKTRTWGLHPFGFEVSGYSTFEGVTIPSAGRAGWFYGTDRWNEGEFFRSEITDYHLVGSGV
jgi:hypothetical protein